MMRNSTRLFGALLGAALFAGCADDDDTTAPVQDPVSAEDRALEATATQATLTRVGNKQILRATGSITAAVTQFRALLGEPLNPNTAGQKAGGRREVNWDAVPAAFTNVDTFPGDFFNTRSPRGVIFSTNGLGFRVSDNGFSDVNASYTGAFTAFSPVRTFDAVGSTITDVRFVVAGSTTAARTTGFGVVFSGADLSRSATVEFYDAAGTLLLSLAAPREVDTTGLSFVGAVFDTPIVAKVRVVMDDFLYGEPQQIQ